MPAAKAIKVITPGPVQVNRAETAGKTTAFLSGGPVKVEAAQPVGSFKLVGTGAPGAPGPQGPQGPAGETPDIDNLNLDGGNF